MTSHHEKTNARTASVFFISVVAVLLIILFTVCSDTVRIVVTDSLALSATSVIPSVFPCAFLSSVLASVGGGDVLAKLFGAPLSRLLKISKGSAAAVISGLLCGFPIGAVTAFELYKNNAISKDELFSAVAVSSVPSPAFVIGAVGGAMLGNKKHGVLLYFAVLLSNFICAHIFFRKNEKETSFRKNVNISEKCLVSSVVSSVPSAVFATLSVTAYILFFSALCACLSDIAVFFGVSDVIIATLHGFLEMSGGCAEAVSVFDNALPLCSAFLSFSGMSVHFQIMSSTDSSLPLGKYFLFMTVRALIAFIVIFSVVSIPFRIY